MSEHSWIEEFPGAVTVCDADGVILAMNAKSAQTFAKEGGATLIGHSLMDCHPTAAQAKLRALLESGQSNVYTIEKEGQKKLIYQSPWYRDGKYAGFVELSLVIPVEMPHFVRG